MKNRPYIRHGSCLSLMAMLPTIFGPTLMMQPAEAQDAGGSAVVVVDPNDILFWAMAWGISYDPYQYSMVMEPSDPGSSLWNVQVWENLGLDYSDPNLTEEEIQSQIVAQGSFNAFAWHFLDQASQSSIDPVDGITNTTTIGLYAIAGEFTGSTGFTSPVYGMATRVHAVNDGVVGQEALYYTFKPIGFDLSFADADAWALDLYNTMQTPLIGDPLPPGEVLNPHGLIGSASGNQTAGDSGCPIPLCPVMEGPNPDLSLLSCECLAWYFFNICARLCDMELQDRLLLCLGAAAGGMTAWALVCLKLPPVAVIPCMITAGPGCGAIAYLVCAQSAYNQYEICMLKCRRDRDLALIDCGFKCP